MPPLGFIEPKDRTTEQQDAHLAAVGRMKAFTLAPHSPAPGEKVILTRFLKDPDVVADMGMEFDGFHQLTGSCVGNAEGNGLAALSAIQRKISDNPTKAFVPFWAYPYGRTRYHEGDRGQGEGAVSSVMATTLETDGYFSAFEPGLPTFTNTDGISYTQSMEMQWSDGGSALVTKWIPVGKQHVMGTRGPIYTAQDVVTAIANGYPVLNGCAYYIGGGSIHGSGDTAYVRGKYDNRGGHETGWYGYWNHPNDGLLFLYWNQWPASTYPKDPAGGPRCSVWTPESEVTRMLDGGWNGIDKGEAFALSHLSWFPAQVDKILSFADIGA